MSTALRWLAACARDAAIVLITVATIIVAVQETHPIFESQPSAVAGLLARTPVSRPLGPLPTDSGTIATALRSPQFVAERRAFAADLVRTGRMSPERADSISYYAVRESYVRGVPPPVVLGVMLTENAKFLSGARSTVGAVGLMQVYPKIWLGALSDVFGADLGVDSTNLKYGIYILSRYINSTRGRDNPAAVNTGLLRYNGCVRGTNTPRCWTYPSKVRAYVNREAESLCGNRTFYQCIAKPFMAGLQGRGTP